MVFIHKSEDTQLVASMHSVTFLNDEGFWFYDLNIGGIKKIDCISSLGQLGERFLIEKMI